MSPIFDRNSFLYCVSYLLPYYLNICFYYFFVGIYDEETETDFDADEHDWVDYWRKMFRQVTVQDIQNYEMKYIGKYNR